MTNNKHLGKIAMKTECYSRNWRLGSQCKFYPFWEHDGWIYHRDRKYQILNIQNTEIKYHDVFQKKYKGQIFAGNDRGIFTKQSKDIFLYSYEGDLLGKIKLKNMNETLEYIYDNKLYSSQVGDRGNTYDTRVFEYDILTGEQRIIWDAKTFFKCDHHQLRRSYLRMVCATDRYLLTFYDQLERNDSVSYVIAVDLKSMNEIQLLKYKEKESEVTIEGANMQEEQIFFQYKHAIMGISISSLITGDIESGMKVILKLNSKTNKDFNMEYADYYFDDNFACVAPSGSGSVDFYVLDKEGNTCNWNQEGHGEIGEFWVSKNWVSVSLDKTRFRNGEAIFRKQFKCPRIGEGTIFLLREKDLSKESNQNDSTNNDKKLNPEEIMERLLEAKNDESMNDSRVMVFGQEIREKSAAASYVVMVQMILERYPELLGQWEAVYTCQEERAARYTGKTRKIIVHGRDVYINTGNNTTVKRKQLKEMLKKAGNTEQMFFYE